MLILIALQNQTKAPLAGEILLFGPPSIYALDLFYF